MAFRQAAREPEKYELDWGERFTALPWTEDRTEEIAAFLLSTGEESFTCVEECADGTAESARRYVTRAREHMQGKPDADVGYEASSLVYETARNRLVAICLCCGPSLYLIEVHPEFQRQGLGTTMLKRALTVYAEHGVERFDLWRDDDSVGAALYERLGFRLTGEVE